MALYNLDPITGVLQKEDGSIIPSDDSIPAYLEYVQWLEAGNSPTISSSANTDPDAPSYRVSKLDFINKFTDVEYCAVLTMAKSIVQLEAWLRKVDMTTPNADGTSIDLKDPRTIAGVTAVLHSLEQSGVIADGTAQLRVQQVLS